MQTSPSEVNMTARTPAGRVFAALGIILLLAPLAGAQTKVEYRVLSTTKTSTMQKEMLEAADAGFRFADVMGVRQRSAVPR
jgi:hypothetical protein